MRKPVLTRVVNIRNEPYDTYMGRGGPWGNPFPISPTCDRRLSCKKHRTWLLLWIRHRKEIIINGLSNKWVIAHLGELRGCTLGCFCKPLACHVDFIIELLSKRIKGGFGRSYLPKKRMRGLK